eukprot:COSAG01_NODE_492_length_16335_cov_63.722284_24_plen_93_part_00
MGGKHDREMFEPIERMSQSVTSHLSFSLYYLYYVTQPSIKTSRLSRLLVACIGPHWVGCCIVCASRFRSRFSSRGVVVEEDPHLFRTEKRNP